MINKKRDKGEKKYIIELSLTEHFFSLPRQKKRKRRRKKRRRRRRKKIIYVKLFHPCDKEFR